MHVLSEDEKITVDSRMYDIYALLTSNAQEGTWHQVYQALAKRAVRRSEGWTKQALRTLDSAPALLEYALADPAVAGEVQHLAERICSRIAIHEQEHGQTPEDDLPKLMLDMLRRNYPLPNTAAALAK